MRLTEFLSYAALTVATLFFVQAVVSAGWSDRLKHAFRAMMALLLFGGIGIYWLATGEKPDETAYRYMICPFVDFERCKSDGSSFPKANASSTPAGAQREDQAQAKKRIAELKRRREVEGKRKEGEREFDAETISALLNKAATKRALVGAPDAKASPASLIQIIRSCVQSKWVVPKGAGTQDAKVKMRLRLRPDGTLIDPPEIMNSQESSGFLAVSQSALKAVRDCEPFALPPEQYETWKDIVLNFDLREML